MNESTVNPSVMPAIGPTQQGAGVNHGGLSITPQRHEGHPTAAVTPAPLAHRFGQAPDTEGTEEDSIATNAVETVETLDEDTFGADISDGTEAFDPGTMGHESSGREDTLRYSALHEPAMMLTAADATFIASDPAPLALAQPMEYLGSSAAASGGSDAGAAAVGSTAMGELMPMLGAVTFGVIAATSANNATQAQTPNPSPTATGTAPPLVFSISHAAGTPHVMVVDVTLPSTMVAGQTLTFSVAQGNAVLETVNYVLTQTDINAGSITKFLGSNNLSDSNYQISVNQAGTTALASNTSTFHLDVTAPSAPQLNLSPNGNGTTVNVSLPIDAVVGDSLTLTLRDQTGSAVQTVTQAVTALNLSTHTLQLSLNTGALPANTSYQALANLTDVSGNVSINSTPISMTTPGAPTPGITLTQDSGTPGDRITNQAGISLSGVLSSGVVEYSVDGGAWTSVYTAPTQNGNHTVQVRQFDTNTGHVSNPGSLSFTLDTLAPAALIPVLANGANGLTNSAALAALTPEVGALLEYRVDGGAWASSYTAPTGDIAHTVDVRQTDAAGNISAWFTLSFTLDTVAPASVTPTLANGATTLTNNAALTALSATEVGATVEYRVDGGAWGAYTAPSAQGAHTVEARQVDAAGNASAASAPLAFTLDTQAPVAPGVALSNGNPAGSTTNNGSVSVTGIEAGATVEYQINASGTWLPLVADAQGAYNVPSPTVPGLSYTIDVRQTDAAGNVSTTVGSINFALAGAGSAPTVGLVNDTGVVGDAITSVGQLQITPAADTAPNSTVQEFSTDGGQTWSTSFTPTSNAVNVVEVRYNNPSDTTGNSATLPASFTFTLDTQVVAPTLSLQTGTSALTNSSAVTLGGIEAGASVEYSTDGATWTAQQPVATQGSNTLYVRQTDVAGNVSAASTALSFNLDSVAPTAPVVVLTNGATTLTNNAALAALTGVEAGALLEYRVDGGAWASSYTAPTANAAHTVDVRQTDAAGNVSPTSSLSFTLDTLAPAALTPVLANGANGLTNSAALAALTPEVGALLEYRVDGGAWASSYTAPTANAAHTVDVRQTDAAGNVSPTSSLSFTLDTVAPAALGLALALANGANGLTNSAALAALTPEVGALLEYRVDGGAWASSYTAPTANAAHTVDVRQTDAAGNVSLASTPLAFTLDTVAPVALTVALLTDSADATAAPAVFGAQIADKLTNDPTANFVPETAGNLVEYSVDGINNWQPLSALAPGVLADGAYNLFVRETDAAGNVTTSATGTYSFTLDTVSTAPTLALNAPILAGGVTYSQTGSFWDPLGGLLTGGTSTSTITDLHPSTEHYTYTDATTGTPITTDLLGMQNYLLTLGGLINQTTGIGIPVSVTVTQTDAAGNASAPSAPLSFTFDNMTPLPVVGLATDSGRLNDVTTNQPTFSLLATEAQTTEAYSFDGMTWTSIPTLVNGTFTPTGLPIPAQVATPTAVPFWVQQTDATGNVGTFMTTFMVDNFVAAPTVQATDSTGALVGSGTLVSSGTLTLTGETSLAPTYQVSTDSGITWVDSSIYTPTAMGANNILVHQIDDAGNISAATTFNLNLQGTVTNVTTGLSSAEAAGVSPFITLPTMSLTDSGIAGDHITSNATVTLNAANLGGNVDTLSYSLNGGLWTAYTPGSSLPAVEGLNSLLVKESVQSGAIGTLATHETPIIPMSFTLDTVFPTAGATANNIAELYTSASSGLSTAVVRVTYSEAVSVNAATLNFSGGGAAGGYTSQVVTSGASLDGAVSLGVQVDGSTVIEVRLAETTLHAFTTAQVVPSVSLLITDLAGNQATVPIAVTNNPAPVFADWNLGMLP
ncbi:hypothetical protein LepocDRAFT_00004060 [Leptothrix ochracea L12]|uniref:Ig-like domain-containing protein n=1 Tax=Leptothrix ochracea L12 TaxID=735332 RepID=I4Z630_9BURK|nr:hypothetical protein [Leptothrix ochracea]EIM31672.1 hypothetical protein LepocDRAFT_00004060 [Leptothrix ochracea L12]